MLTPRFLFLLPALLFSSQAALRISPEAGLRTVHDAADHITFTIPADWPLSTHDRELSTFHDEARTAPRTARLRLVAALPENPYLESTLSGLTSTSASPSPDLRAMRRPGHPTRLEGSRNALIDRRSPSQPRP